MNYAETLDYLYTRLPMFQRQGAAAYKPTLDNTLALCEALGNPQQKFTSIHVAGTNGKGSSSHLLAAMLQSAGWRTGLYTSPHLKHFTERIRINGQEITPSEVVDFVARIKPVIERVQPSFFELTVAMAFDYFARQGIDIAVIEVGLGGRLDSTNVVQPLVSLITNISYDHQALLGNTLPQIAFEKAGIIKQGVPVVLAKHQPEVAAVFRRKAELEGAPLYFAPDDYEVRYAGAPGHFEVWRKGQLWLADFRCELLGHYQPMNLVGVLKTLEVLNALPQLSKQPRPKPAQGWVSEEAIREGAAQVATLTGLRGRWQILGHQPLTVADTCHNEDGVRQVVAQIETCQFDKLHWVLGMVSDKDVAKVLELLPKQAIYYFCKPDLPRGLHAEALHQQAAKFDLHGNVYGAVAEAYQAARAAATANDMIMIGGSNFLVAEVL